MIYIYIYFEVSQSFEIDSLLMIVDDAEVSFLIQLKD